MSVIKYLLEQVCYLHSKGWTDDEIACELGITINNVKDTVEDYYDLMYGEAL